MNNKGFSLIELVIVIAIIGILSLIGLTRFSGMTDKANIAVDESNAAEIANAAKMYLALNSNRESVSLQDLIEDKLIDGTILDSTGTLNAKSSLYEKGPISLEANDGDIVIKYGAIEAYPNKKSSSDSEVIP